MLKCLAVVLCVIPNLAFGQSSAGDTPFRATGTPEPSVLTIFTVPENAEITVQGEAGVVGRTPLDLPALMTGLHSIVVQSEGLARTQGVISVPPRGGLPFVASEPPGPSFLLLYRGLNFPGVPDLRSGRTGRGATLTAAGVSAVTLVVARQFRYRERLDEVGDYAADRARDERSYRNAWLIYGAATWGMSALDYWIRPRLSLIETTPTRLTVGVPRATRGGAVWRSILVPGAGQEFGNHRTRSVVWLGSVLMAGAGYVVSDYKVDRDETDYKFAQLNADSAGPSEQAQRNEELDQAERSLEASENIRQGFFIGIFALHAINIVDAMIMPLRLRGPDKPKVASIGPAWLQDGPGVVVSLRL